MPLFPGVCRGIAAAALVSCVTTTRAAADQLADAQAYVITQTKNHVNVLATGCSKLITKNSKNVCFLTDFSDTALIGYANGRKKGDVEEEYKTLVILAGWNVAVVPVGSQFIEPLACSTSDSAFRCGGFVEEKLSGTEVYWAAYQAELVDKPRVETCDPSNQAYVTKVAQAYHSTAVIDGKSALATLVHGKDENWREELSGDVISAAQTFAKQKTAVIDLQAFVAEDGNMSIFDPQGLSTNAKFYTCWSAALVVLSDLIDHDTAH